MKGQEFLATAERLSKGASESDWRSGVSRAYYAVFHHVREAFLAHGLNIGRGAQAHFNLYSGLLHCGFPAVGSLGSRVDRLRADRVESDYDLQKTVNSKRAQDAVQAARALIADFDAILLTITPVQIVAGARSHLQAIGKIGRTP